MPAIANDSSLTEANLLYTQKLFASLKSYWQSMAQDAGGIPYRKQFSPAGVRSLLPHLYMLEYVGENEMQFRHRGTGIEHSTNHRFLIGDHMKNYGEKEWKLLQRYFKVIFSGPYGAEGEWRFYCKDDRVFDMLTYSLPMYGKTEGERIALGLMMVWPNYEPSLKDKCRTYDYDECRRAVFLDIGYGEPDKALNYGRH